MTALWVSLAVVVALLLAWRIRRATKLLDRIMSEELDAPERADRTGRADTDRDEQAAEHRHPQS